jgi:hypothetical protein
MRCYFPNYAENWYICFPPETWRRFPCYIWRQDFDER